MIGVNLTEEIDLNMDKCSIGIHAANHEAHNCYRCSFCYCCCRPTNFFI